MSRTEATGNERAADPRGEDRGEVELHRLISPALNFVAGVDERLNASGIDV